MTPAHNPAGQVVVKVRLPLAAIRLFGLVKQRGSDTMLFELIKVGLAIRFGIAPPKGCNLYGIIQRS
jgi:hypothetical protein